MPPPCDEGFCFAGCLVLRDSSSGVERLRILSGRELESAVVIAVYSTYDPGITSKSLQLGPVLGDLDTRPPGAPVSHAWAYRDFLDDVLATLSVVQHSRQLWTLVIRMP
ncbi:hypothetical protein CDL15_Pgr015115 [Punica granatum]|uniref:Uncharacterized protein n=1 Tax=Punica granatum TaxID=22663 RepID=A0A218WW52_PUNGR|nr:hypothetical protein CDL15_Pgr015115 [Punica granatum]